MSGNNYRTLFIPCGSFKPGFFRELLGEKPATDYISSTFVSRTYNMGIGTESRVIKCLYQYSSNLSTYEDGGIKFMPLNGGFVRAADQLVFLFNNAADQPIERYFRNLLHLQVRNDTTIIMLGIQNLGTYSNGHASLAKDEFFRFAGRESEALDKQNEEEVVPVFLNWETGRQEIDATIENINLVMLKKNNEIDLNNFSLGRVIAESPQRVGVLRSLLPFWKLGPHTTPPQTQAVSFVRTNSTGKQVKSDFRLSIAVQGIAETGTGVTSLIFRLINNRHDPYIYPSRGIEMEHLYRDLQINGKVSRVGATLQMFPGRSRHAPRYELPMKSGMVKVMVLDFFQPGEGEPSLARIQRMVNTCYNPPWKVPLFFIINKIDRLDQNEYAGVDHERIQNFIGEIRDAYPNNPLKFYYTSAVNGEGVGEAFDDIMRESAVYFYQVLPQLHSTKPMTGSFNLLRDRSVFFNAGICFQFGINTDKDVTKAVEYYRYATGHNCKQSANNLGWCYLHGKGVEADIDLAQTYLEKAADSGLVEAIFNLAQCHGFRASGLNLKSKGAEKAFELYQKAAEKGHTRALFCLSLCYLSGAGVVSDAKEAVRLCKRAAEKNDPEALELVALWHEYGENVFKSTWVANRYRQRAELLRGGESADAGLYKEFYNYEPILPTNSHSVNAAQSQRSLLLRLQG